MEPSATGKIAVIIPFYNEEKTIGEVIALAMPHCSYIIAVNDGSSDKSVENIPESNKVILVHSETNKGKGTALRTGFTRALETDAEFIVTLDADLQHPPDLIPKFSDALLNFQILIGCRKRDTGNMPFLRKMSNTITSAMLTSKTGMNFSDSQSGYRAFRREVILDILPNESGYEAETEMLIKAARLGFSVGEISIPTIYTGGGSKMRYLPTIAGFIKVILKRY